MTKLSRSFILGCSIMALAACGPEELASPGTGGNVTIINEAPPAAPTPTPTPSQALVTPAGGCPTITDPQGLTDEGTISGPEGTWRVCALPLRIDVDTSLPFVEGLLYRLPGQVNVGSDGGPSPDASDGLSDTGVDLTIAPGAIFYAQGSSFLNVQRGNRIFAIGTAARPIIFTSRDNIVGINNDNSQGQWGGIVLSGRGQVTDCIAPLATPGTTACERRVEGAASESLFGGATNTDNSGELRYVQIRYSGFILGSDNELQGLTTGGIGSGTQLSFLQSHNSSDDGVEFFGGNVDVTNLVVTGADDDAIDFDTGAQLRAQFVFAAQRPGAGDTIIEADSTNGLFAQTPRTVATISNATFIQRRDRSQVIHLQGASSFSLWNSVVIEATSGQTPCIRRTNNGSTANEDVDVSFQSVALTCDVNFAAGANNSSGVARAPTAAETEAAFNAGAGNQVGFVNTITSGYLSGASETGFTPIFNANGVNSFFDVVTFIGAVSPADDWTAGWVCNSTAASFVSSTGDCRSVPVFTS